MMQTTLFIFILELVLISNVKGYSSHRHTHQTSRGTCSSSATLPHCRLQSQLKARVRSSDHKSKREKSKCDLCPEPEVDRREAAFALIGTMWSVGSLPSPANAVFGADAKIEIPNVMDNINNRVNQQCLVESLGNRECLVYLDPENKLYKGADSQILIERLEAATAALAEIPSLVSDKKWSKIQGVLTGPMNPLGVTMDKLSKISENEENCCKLEKVVKSDLYAIASAVERKQGDEIIKLHKKATEDLVAYAQAL
mmetsp:Transcript_19311/g.28932  ORF Transcript_19311/g.28932 Transcript_19311/m.28932 type:complete len:255 (-) Transcript_19311:1246-2010(-)